MICDPDVTIIGGADGPTAIYIKAVPGAGWAFRFLRRRRTGDFVLDRNFSA